MTTGAVWTLNLAVLHDVVGALAARFRDKTADGFARLSPADEAAVARIIIRTAPAADAATGIDAFDVVSRPPRLGPPSSRRSKR